MIRAAYRALMRRYHPDTDPSREAAQRAQALNAAYAVLGDPDKRARYDGSLAAQGLIKPELPHRAGLAQRMIPGPAGLIGLAALAAAATLIAISPPIGVLPDEALPLSAKPKAGRAAFDDPGVAPPSKAAADLCGDPTVTELIKAELLRRAAAVTGADRNRLQRVGSFASLRLTAPSARSPTGAGSCSAGASLDLPPGTVVDGGRTNLNADLTYRVIESGSGVGLSGLSGAGRLVRSLATIGPAPSEVLDVVPVPPVRVAEVTRTPPSTIATKRSTAPPTTAAPASGSPKMVEKLASVVPAKPAASACRPGSGWADRAVCGNSNLAALDRQHGLLYAQSLAKADQGKRAALLGSRERFQVKRDACRSENCLTSAYIARLREISDIMARGSQQ